MEKYLKICFTGHRPNSLPWRNNEKSLKFLLFKAKIKWVILKQIKNNYNYFITGMALGSDIICAEIILDLKQKYNLFLECAIPCKDQTNKWKIEDKIRYENILKNADKITFVADKNYFKGCMKKRNEYMVNNSNLILAIFNGKKSGGTYQTINYALKTNKKVIIIKP